MTPERKEQIKNKLTHADVWDDSKMEFHAMLYEAMEYIEKLERDTLIGKLKEGRASIPKSSGFRPTSRPQRFC
jgi:hypothetical protein